MTTTDVFAPSHTILHPKPRLLFFHSLRSGPSRRAEGYLAQVLQRGHNHDTFQLQRIAQEEHPELVERLRVVTLPTLLIVEGKAVRGRLERPQGARAIEQFLLPWLRASEARRRSRSIHT
jgi:thioredoxin-like negative regulator of GroEL